MTGAECHEFRFCVADTMKMIASTALFLMACGIALVAVGAAFDPTHIKGSVSGDFEYLGSLCFPAGTSTTIDVIFKAGPTGGIGQNLIVFTQNSIDEIFSAEDNGAPKTCSQFLDNALCASGDDYNDI